MLIDSFPEYIFWNYNKNKDLPEMVVARQVILYGDIPDIERLIEKVSRTTIRATLIQLSKNKRNSKRINFIQKIFLSE